MIHRPDVTDDAIIFVVAYNRLPWNGTINVIDPVALSVLI
jgi:hypothetical protein